MKRLQTYQRTSVKEDVAKVTEDGKLIRGRERGCGQRDGGRDAVAYYTEAVNSNVWFGNETFAQLPVCPLRDNDEPKSMKQVTKDNLYEKVGGIFN